MKMTKDALGNSVGLWIRGSETFSAVKGSSYLIMADRELLSSLPVDLRNKKGYAKN